jgi:hypothetical protein
LTYIVCQVCGPTQTFYEDTKREFDDYYKALNFLLGSFKTMYGDKCIDNYTFWDPMLQEDSISVHTIELFAPGEEDGWFMYKDWDNIQ